MGFRPRDTRESLSASTGAGLAEIAAAKLKAWGMWLSIVNIIVEAHGGQRDRVRSEVGREARFFACELPLNDKTTVNRRDENASQPWYIYINILVRLLNNIRSGQTGSLAFWCLGLLLSFEL